MSLKAQSTVFRGIYEFEDPSGSLLAAKVPAQGSVDLYDGTAVIVRPGQCALFVYNGLVADVLLAGSHVVHTANLPILSRLANWKFGFQNPLRAELIFIAANVFTARRWGTAQPAIIRFKDLGAVPVRAFGNYSLVVWEPRKFYLALMGTKSSLSVPDVEDFIQGQIIESLPRALEGVKSINELAINQTRVGEKLEHIVDEKLRDYGVGIKDLQVLSLLPSKEIVDAIDAKVAIQVIGDQHDYLMYKAANSLGGSPANASSEPMKLMMGMALGKTLLDSHPTGHCESCGHETQTEFRYCPHCGMGIKL